MTPDFTLEVWGELCRAIQALPLEILTIARFLEAGQPQDGVMMLRHDVDRAPGWAVRMAEMESALGISATYYLRAVPSVARPEVMVRLHALGHEVGYHYEVLSKARGDQERAMQQFEQELATFRQYVPIKTISMHGSPLSRWNNLHMWQQVDFGDYDLLGEASMSVSYEQIYYFTDTGGSWDADRYNIRDRLASARRRDPVHTTQELVAFLHQQPGANVLISAHPSRWASTPRERVVSGISDWVINRGKWLIWWWRGVRNTTCAFCSTKRLQKKGSVQR